MTFLQQDSVTRDPHIRDVEITLYRTIEEGGSESVEYRITIDDQLDRPMGHRQGNLVPHLTAGQISALQEFFNKYQALCEEYGFNITVIPTFKARDDGTWSIVLQSSIQPLKQNE